MIEELQKHLRELSFLLMAAHTEDYPEFSIDLTYNQYTRLKREMHLYFNSKYIMPMSVEANEDLTTAVHPIKLMIPPNIYVTFKIKE